MNGLMHRSKQRLYYSNGHFPAAEGRQRSPLLRAASLQVGSVHLHQPDPSKINDKMREVLFGATQYKPV